MALDRWKVTDIVQDDAEAGSHSVREESSRNGPTLTHETKTTFRRLDVLSGRVQKRMGEADVLLSKIRQGEECSEFDEVLIDQLQQAINTFISEIKDLSQNAYYRGFIEEGDYTATQMDAEDMLVSVKRMYKNKMKREKPQSFIHNSNTTSRLPKIELPKFDGNKLKWYEFWGRFKSSIDSRQDLPDIDKLDYLLGQLEGDAKESIQGLDITESNYAVALGILNDTFGKPDLIIDAHYEALDNITPAKDDPKDCRKVLNQVERHLKVLQTLGEDVNKNNQMRHMLPKKFPRSLRFDLNMVMRDQDNTVQNLRKALAEIIAAKETTHGASHQQEPIQPKISFTTESLVANSSTQKRHASYEGSDPSSSSDQREKRESSTQLFSQGKSSGPSTNKRRRFQCIFCDGDHFPDQCHKFPTVDERKNRLKGRCTNCLGSGHIVRNCPRSSRTCFHCKKPYHHRSLCFQRFKRDNPENKREDEQKTVSTLTYSQSDTVLQTALANILNPESGDIARYRLLFDTRSQKSYVTNKVAEQLKLTPIEESSLTIYTFGQPKPKTIDSQLVYINVEIPHKGTVPVIAYVVPTITGTIPSFSSLKKDIEQVHSELVMAKDDNQDSKAEILIGNDHYHSFFSGAREHIKDNLYLLESKLGWIVSGCQFQNDRDVLSMLTYVQTGRSQTKNQPFTLPDPPLQDDLIKVIWELESIGIRDSPKVLEGDEIIKFFNETTVFENNRYQVKWPWIQYPTDLPINYGMAFGRLISLINRTDQATLVAYDQVLKDQLEKGIIEIVDEAKLPEGHAVHYLPHHGVSQPHKTTKLRIVYDASAKSKGKSSLNEYLFKGPLMLEDLLSLLITFRNNQIGITADIEKAFLQVGLQREDRDVTRFLWIKDINKSVTEDNVVHMRFCRVPFGVISSPYLLAATIRYHLTKKHSDIAENVAKCLYVDNLVTGAPSVEAGNDLYCVAVEAFSELSMNIRDWMTNSPQLRELILPRHRCETSVTTVLGLRWNTDTDMLSLMVDPRIFERSVSSKREILQVVASVYDPCGFTAPLTLAARIFLQLLWTEQYKWDTPLPDDKVAEWKLCVPSLKFIPNVEIPRYYFHALTAGHEDYINSKTEVLI